MTKSQISTLLLFSVLIVVLASCKENSVSVSAAGERGEVTGSWMPLSEGDTLEVYVRLEDQIHLGDPNLKLLVFLRHISRHFRFGPIPITPATH